MAERELQPRTSGHVRGLRGPDRFQAILPGQMALCLAVNVLHPWPHMVTGGAHDSPGARPLCVQAEVDTLHAPVLLSKAKSTHHDSAPSEYSKKSGGAVSQEAR